ncbi:MAG: hypothetical protein U0797_23885 [Gemmataceae bacterium]
MRDNEASGLPGYEGRLGLIAPSFVDCEKIYAGVWGVLAISRMNGTLPPPLLPVPQQTDPVPAFSQLANYRFLTNGIGADLRLPLAEDLTFQGEMWYGQNLSDFRGGVGQGISPPPHPDPFQGRWRGSTTARPVPAKPALRSPDDPAMKT